MPRDKQQIIDDLRSLDLSRYPYYAFEGLIDEMQMIPGIYYTLHRGKRITRARAVSDKYSKADLTYSPHQFCTKCLRANISGYPMFYGSISDANDENFINTRLAACCECSGLLRGDINAKGIDPITFGRWVVTEDINLFAIVSDDQFIKNNPYYQEIHEYFLEETAKQDNIDDFLNIASFWGQEFSNPDIQNDYDYFLTAAFTHLMLTRHGDRYDGILYPSVRSAGYGLNIAITPYAADNKLMLEVVGEGKIYKNEQYSYVQIEKIAELYENQTHYVYKDAERISDNDLLQKLHIASFDELITI